MELIKELKKQKDKDFLYVKENPDLFEINQLLLSASSIEQDVKDKLGLQENEYEKKLKSDFTRTTKDEEIYNTASFVGSQIKTLCDEYDLRCIQLNKYKGAYPPEMLRKINEFSEKNNVGINSIDWFIVAPSETFQLTKHIPKPVDPIILYRTDKHNSGYEATEQDTFVQVYNWGNDFMMFRKLRFMISKYIVSSNVLENLTLTIICSIMLIISLIVSFKLKSNIPYIFGILIFWVNSKLNYNYFIKYSNWNNTNK